LNGDVPPITFKEKIVMVGATAIGIYDLRVTPFGTVFPGLEIHANIADSILSEDFLNRPNWTAIFDVLAILVLGVFLGIVLPRVTVIPGLFKPCLPALRNPAGLCQYHGLSVLR
jgi:adenylate cyclase